MPGLHRRLGLGFSSSRGSGGTPTPTPSPTITSDDGTNIGAVLTVSSGSTLYRNGIAVSAPFTTTDDDARAVFWAGLGAEVSASIEIDSNAVTPPSYSQLMYRVLTGQLSAAPVNVDTSNYILTQPNGTPYTMVLGDLSIYEEGTADFQSADLSALIDGDTTWNNIRVRLEAPSDAYRLVHAVTYQPWAGGSFKFSAYGNFQGGPGHIELYGDPTSDGSGDPTNLAEWELISDYNSSWDYSAGGPTHAIGGAAVSLSAVWDDETDVVTLDLSGFTDTPQAYVRDRTVTDYPIALSPYTAWTNVSDGFELDASSGGNWEIVYRDSAAPDEVYVTGALIPVHGTRPSSLGVTVGEPYGRPYYSVNFEQFRDLLAYQSAMVFNGGPLNGVDQKGFDGVVQGNNGAILSWPSGGVTAISLYLSRTYYGSNIGMHELCSGGILTAANFGTVWGLTSSPSITPEVTAGPNGGVLLNIDDPYNELVLLIYDDVAASLPMTELTLLRADETDPTKVLTADFQTDIDLYGMLRVGSYLIEDTHWSFAPNFPVASTIASHIARLDALDFSSRRQKGSVIDWAPEAGHTTYWNFSPLMPDAYLTALGAFYAANNTNPDVSILAFSLGFENFWNWSTNDYQRCASILFWKAAEWGMLGTTPDYVERTVPWHTNNTATVTTTYALGDWLIAYLSDEGLYGPTLFEKISSATGTTTLPMGAFPASNSDWIVRADLSANGLNGRSGVFRAGAREMARMRAALQTGLGSGIRAVPGFEAWFLGPQNADYTSSNAALNPLRAGLFTPLADGDDTAFIDDCEGRFFIAPAAYPCTTWTAAELAATDWDGTTASDLCRWMDDQIDVEIASGGFLHSCHAFRPLLANLVSEPRTVNSVTKRYNPADIVDIWYEFNTGVNSDNLTEQELIEDANVSIDIEAPFTRVLTDAMKHGGYRLLLGQGPLAPTGGGNFNIQRTIPRTSADRGKQRAVVDYKTANPDTEFA